MALAHCRACGGEASTEAACCPHCGVLASASQGLPSAKSPSPPSSLFRKPPATVRAGQETAVITRPSLDSTGVTRAAREAAIRQRLLWGGGALAISSILLVLARTVTMMVILAPLGLLCTAATGIGIMRAFQNRGLPYLPRTRRLHSVLLVVVVPFFFAVAVQVTPRTAADQQRLDASAAKRTLEEATSDETLIKNCQIQIIGGLQVPSSVSFPGSTKVFRWERQEGGYVIRGAVEAQNAFGARLRKVYECTADAGGQLVSGRILE
jgi:hypothetical protein